MVGFLQKWLSKTDIMVETFSTYVNMCVSQCKRVAAQFCWCWAWIYLKKPLIWPIFTNVLHGRIFQVKGVEFNNTLEKYSHEILSSRHISTCPPIGTLKITKKNQDKTWLSSPPSDKRATIILSKLPGIWYPRHQGKIKAEILNHLHCM